VCGVKFYPPLYQERLGIPDEDYNRLVNKNEKEEKELNEILEYERDLRC
jgi:hypothetical protein